MGFLLEFLISLVLTAVAYVLLPKPKKAQPAFTKDMDNPVAEAGKPVGVVQGTITISGLNVLWYGEKSANTYMVKG